MYELSFSEDFFTGFVPLENIEISDYPTSVFQALVSWAENARESFLEMLGDVLGQNYKEVWAKGLIGETVFYELLDKIRETNTCENLNSPVLVYIDPNYEYSVKVYDLEDL